MANGEESAWWQDTRRLATSALAATLVLALLGAIAVTVFDSGDFFGFLPGYFLAAVVLPFVLAILAFWFCRRQGVVDRRHGLYEE